MPQLTQTSIISAINDLSKKTDSLKTVTSRKNWLIYGLAASSSFLFLLAAVIPNKFNIAQVCVKETCQDEPTYQLVEGVFKRESEFNPKGFMLKTEQIGVIPGNEILIQLLGFGASLGLGTAYLVSRSFTRYLVSLKQQRYETARLVAMYVDGNVKAYLEISEHNLLVEKQARLDERLEIDQIERAQRYSPEQLKELKTKYQWQDEIQKLQYERQVAALRADIDKIQAQQKEPKVIPNKYPEIDGIVWFDWQWFQTRDYDDIPHIRFVGSTGTGKTILGNYVLDLLPGDKVVWTIKRKPHQWQGKTVIGVPEDWERLEIEFQKLEAERKERLRDVENGLEPDIVNVSIDEWRAINNRIECSKGIVRDTLTLSREARQRLLLYAQGRQVKTFGLEDESDLKECMLSVFIGAFAREEAAKYYKNAAHISEESKTKVLAELEKVGNRACWIHASFGDFPAIAPTIEV